MQNILASATNFQIVCPIVLEDHFLASQALTMSTRVSAVAIFLSSSLIFVGRRNK